jgi:phosphotriesterase-related protein
MSFVRTVLGDVPTDEIGWIYAHEHVVIDDSYVTATNPDFHLGDVGRIAAELAECREAGVTCMVDSMPIAAGRNVLKMAEVSRRSQMHLLVPTGLHLAIYYPPGHWSERIGTDALAALFIREITDGIDANDANGPTVERTEHRAGLVKVASSLDGLTDRERRNFEAAAIAHKETGCPILTHTEQGTAGLDQVELLVHLGVDLDSVTLSHLDRNPDLATHRDILQTGVHLEYDSAFRWKGEANPTEDLVLALAPEFPNQLALGMDAARSAYWRSFGGSPGLDYLARRFVPALRTRGLPDDLIRRITHDNPLTANRFRTRTAPC